MDANAIKTLTERHPESVAQLFAAYGYDMPVTARNIELMLKVNGNKPMPVSNADGEKSKKTFGDYLNELIIPGLQIAGTLFGSKKPQVTTTVAPTPATTPQPEPDATPRIAGINRNLFILLFVVVVIIIVLLIKKHAK